MSKNSFWGLFVEVFGHYFTYVGVQVVVLVEYPESPTWLEITEYTVNYIVIL